MFNDPYDVQIARLNENPRPGRRCAGRLALGCATLALFAGGCAVGTPGGGGGGSGNTNADENDAAVINFNENGNGTAASFTCVECHNDKDALEADLNRRPTDHTATGGAACGGSVTRASAVDAVFVNQNFLDSNHGQIACTTCHGGVEPAADRDEAHAGDFRAIVDPENSCGTTDCHGDIVDNFLNNIHTKFNGLTPEDPEFVERAAFHIQRVSDDPELQQLMAEAVEIACADCHRATCGSCHITLPEPSGRGFPNGATGHVIYKTPNTVYNCGACHGGRKAAEFIAEDIDPALLQSDLGELALTTSAHYAPENLKCVDCHGFTWMHGQEIDLTMSLRHEDPELPTCESCHVDDDPERFFSNAYHSSHSDADGQAPHLQCQVCHSQPYPNCASCHVEPGAEGEPPPDLKFYTLKIAKNPFTTASFYTDNPEYGDRYRALGEKRPYDYSLVRRPSIVSDTFDAFSGEGEAVLGNFTAYPTWKYATPHNVQKNTLATAEGCDGCHNNDDLFLTEEYLETVFTEENFPNNDWQTFLQDELQANAEILIDRDAE